MGRRRGKAAPQQEKTSTTKDSDEDDTKTPPPEVTDAEVEASLQLPSPIATNEKVADIAAAVERVAYVIDDTPRNAATDEDNSASASLNLGNRNLVDQQLFADQHLGSDAVETAASTGHSSSDEHQQNQRRPKQLSVKLDEGDRGEGPSYSKSFRRSTQSLSPKEKIPHFMHPLRREISPTQNPLVPPPETITQLEAIAGLGPGASAATTRLLYKSPTTSDIAQRESARRVRLIAFETEELNDIHETYMHDIAVLKATILRREKYLKSYEFAKCSEHGRQQRIKIEQWEAEKAKAEAEVPTFAPQISSHAAKMHPNRGVDGFIRASEEWVAERAKRRRAASAVVFREEETTFHPQVSASSAKIVERLNNTAKRVDVVNGWTERLGAHKKHMEALKEKYACSFQPEMADARRASLHGDRRRQKQLAARRKSASPRRTVILTDVVTRLHDTTIELRKSAQEKLKEACRSVSPRVIRRPQESITNHLLSMSEADKKAQHNIEKKRHKLRVEETQLEHNNFHPVVNPNSVALADLNRQRRSLSQQQQQTAATEASEQREASPAAAKGNIYEMLYTAATTASNNRASSSKALAPSPGSSVYERHNTDIEVAAAQQPLPPATKNISAGAQREFLLRNEKLLQSKALHRKDLLMQLQEFETRECTFAPALSSTTVRLAEYRRSAHRYDDVYEVDDAAEYPASFSRPQQLPATSESVPWRHSLRSELRISPQGGAQRSQSPKPSRPPLAVRPTSASLSSSGKFQRTDNNGGGGAPYLRSSNNGAIIHNDDHHADDSSDAIQERMEDIEGLLRQWKWLEESSRM